MYANFEASFHPERLDGFVRVRSHWMEEGPYFPPVWDKKLFDQVVGAKTSSKVEGMKSVISANQRARTRLHRCCVFSHRHSGKYIALYGCLCIGKARLQANCDIAI